MSFVSATWSKREKAPCGFIRDRSRGDIDTDEQLRFALARAVEIIGEAASKVTLETRSTITSVPWTDIIYMRNRLVHAYFDIDHDIVWETVTRDIPDLLPLIRSLLPSD